jgi:hypothetical protein
MCTSFLDFWVIDWPKAWEFQLEGFDRRLVQRPRQHSKNCMETTAGSRDDASLRSELTMAKTAFSLWQASWRGQIAKP